MEYAQTGQSVGEDWLRELGKNTGKEPQEEQVLFMYGSSATVRGERERINHHSEAK